MTDQLDLIADASKLRILADWFDAQDASARSLGVPTSDDVQRDLRRIADYLASDERASLSA